MHIRTIILLATLLLHGCAGPNPNPGERRTTDMAWLSGDFERALAIVKPKAEQGQPWAQLRLGIFYENGWGVEKNARKAVEWYKKALEQKATGEWAEGLTIGASGRPGYFNQNSDARIAAFNLAQMYAKGDGIEKDLVQAFFHVTNVIDESGGKAIFFVANFQEVDRLLQSNLMS
jgi:TPR repeat protein